jgi:iron complex transport system ATP-binding protein
MPQEKNVHFNYGLSTVLSDISFNVEEGQLCGLFGPNGCGKTTLFKCCMKFLKYQQGSVVMDSVDIKDCRIEDMAEIVAYVPQEHKPPFPIL